MDLFQQEEENPELFAVLWPAWDGVITFGSPSLQSDRPASLLQKLPPLRLPERGGVGLVPAAQAADSSGARR